MKFVSWVGYFVIILTIASFVAPASISFATTKASLSTAASVNVSSESPNSIERISSLPISTDGSTVNMSTIMDKLGLTETQKIEAIKEVFYAVHHSKQARSRYYYLTTKISAKEVKKMKSFYGSASSVISAISALVGYKFARVGMAIKLASAALYYSYWYKVKTAAKHGWGLKESLRVDSYTQTSAGMTWTVSYVK